MPTLELCHDGAVLFCVLYIQVHVLVTQRQDAECNYEYVPTRNVLDLSSTTPKICFMHKAYFIFCYMVYAQLRVILVARLRYVHSSCKSYLVSYIGRKS